MEEPNDLVYFSKVLSPSEMKQQDFAVVRNIASRVHHWLFDRTPTDVAMGEAHGAADAAPEPAPAPAPSKPRNIAAVLGAWTFADSPAPAATAALDAEHSTLSPSGEPFPSWHVRDDELADGHTRKYEEPPGPKNGAEAFTSDPSDPRYEHELTFEEYRSHNLETLYWQQRRYKVQQGFKLPYVKRLSPEDPRVKAIVKAVTEARAALPDVPIGDKGVGKLAWTKWTALGKNTKPLIGEGWMYLEDPKSEYSQWLYRSWLKGYVDNLDTVARLPHLAALRTMHQEGAPSSLNTYDSCIMTWGVGFACGAPQIVQQLLSDADCMNALYACGLRIKAFVKDAKLATTPGLHYQTLDLSDPAHPKVLVWDNYYHFYGYAPSGGGAEVAVRPSAFDPAYKHPTSKRYDVRSANPMPQAGSEASFHIFNHMTNREGKEVDVLRAFVALARDERTRASVSEANRTLIVKRAALALPELQTEAAYTFVSMCKHNWGLGNAELTFDHLSSYLSKAEGDLVREWITRGFADAERWTESDLSPPTIEFRFAAAKATRNRRHAMVYNDALIAKAVVRKVMSLLEVDRIEEAKKRYLKAEREGRAHTIALLDERLRKYSYLWRFDRLVDYWKEMTTGDNWLRPMRAAARLAGEASPGLKARIDPKAPQGFRDAPREVNIVRFDDGFNMLVSCGGEDLGKGEYLAPFKMEFEADAAVPRRSRFHNLGPMRLMRLPEVVEKYGQDLELLHVKMVEEKGKQKITELHWQKRLGRTPSSDEALAQRTIVTDYVGKSPRVLE